MTQLKVSGRVLRPSDPGFGRVLRDTCFNRRETVAQPALLVQPQTVQDVIATVAYARAVGQRISIRSGGHSWSANHLRDESIVLDMSGFNEYHIDREQMTATAGPGVGGSVLLTALFKQGLFFPAGHCEGVCLGGYLLQGGFAWHGRKLGMACESVTGLDIVTAEGVYLHASATENADLYWAARGAGGGFCGVVVRFHLKLYPRPKYSGMMAHIFALKHLEAVFEWAAEVGPNVPTSVELQLLMSRRTMKFFAPGIEVAAPIFADTADELHEAKAVLVNSPIKGRAWLRVPYLETGVKRMYRMAMTHYPAGHCWGVDNMWTHAGISELLPYLREIAASLPPPPTHLLWLNWQPPVRTSEMAFSLEDKIYLALYGGWRDPADTARYGTWARDWMREMAHLASGIQLADENLRERRAAFMGTAQRERLEQVRGVWDEQELFHKWRIAAGE